MLIINTKSVDLERQKRLSLNKNVSGVAFIVDLGPILTQSRLTTVAVSVRAILFILFYR